MLECGNVIYLWKLFHVYCITWFRWKKKEIFRKCFMTNTIEIMLECIKLQMVQWNSIFLNGTYNFCATLEWWLRTLNIREWLGLGSRWLNDYVKCGYLCLIIMISVEEHCKREHIYQFQSKQSKNHINWNLFHASTSLQSFGVAKSLCIHT